jgi:DNA-binding Lrp family transcriptional regulator
MADHEKLGLHRIVVVLDFAGEYRKFSPSILASMNELCFLTGFAKTMPEGDYIASFSAPRESIDKLKSFLNAMKEKGMFSRLDIFDFDWIRFAPMKAECYDFDTGRWDFDWSSPKELEFGLASYTPSSKTRFDHTDLLLLKELYVEADRPLVDIAKKIDVSYKKLAWHYAYHVLSRGLIKGYTVRWPGTRFDQKTDKAHQRRHRYFWIDVLVRDVAEAERMGVMAKIGRLPFLWAEAVGKSFFAQLALPVDFLTESLQYIEGALSEVKERAELWLPDQTHALAFTIGYKLYDEKLGQWTFDAPSIEVRFDQLIMKIK